MVFPTEVSKEKVEFAKTYLKRTYVQAALAFVVLLTMIGIVKSRKQPIGVYIDSSYMHDFTEAPYDAMIVRTFNEHLRLFTTNCMCRKIAVGNINRDGYLVGCFDPYTQPNCLVYSFGSKNEYNYENAVFSEFGCEMHAVNTERYPAPPHVQFHKAKFGNCPDCQSVSSILKDNGHLNTTISALRIDVEGREWDILDQIFLDNVNQIQMEIHAPNYERMRHLDRFRDRFCLVDTNTNVMGREVLKLVFVNKNLMKSMDE
ncbi:methyltransferase domain-containing protein [Gongronella butleri]|nr:methyltransferase domain-containing protein [Gongronella butleri]